MGLISSDQRPRDWGYKVAFDSKDLPSLQEMVKQIQDTHNTDIIEDFNLKCEQTLRGEPSTLQNGVEIQQVTKTEDLVVTVGLQQCINIILGTSSSRWDRFAFARNNGNNPPQVIDGALDNSAGGMWYVSMGTYGWQEPKGMKLFFGTITPQDTGDPNFSQGTIHEMGIFNQNLVLLNRELFFKNPLGRSTSADGQMYKQVFMFSCVIEFCPVA